MTLLSGAYQKPAEKHASPKKGGEPAATGGKHTQVGELAAVIKAPTPAMRIKSMAHDEKLHATRRWVSGEITNAKHAQIHKRADHAIKNAHKLGSKK